MDLNIFEDTYRTIPKPSEAVFRDRGSKFIAYAYPMRDEGELKGLLNEVRSLHPKARHYCWAFRLSPDRTVYRVNDDGEPSGSAGRPILNALLSAEVTNVLIVVVRYFGGTLLGVPGLINAYRTAAKESLEAVEIVERTVNDVYALTFDYLAMNDVMRIVKEEDLILLKQEFDNLCRIEFELRQSRVSQVLDRMEKLDLPKPEYVRTV